MLTSSASICFGSWRSIAASKEGDDENIINFTSRAKMIQDDLATLSNPMDDNTLALRDLSGLICDKETLIKVLENKDVELGMSDLTAKLLYV